MGEACDDGGESATCNPNCTKAACGDSIVNMSAGEECDDGNNVNTDACVALCKKATCGDSFVQAGVEECDGGGETATCSAECKVKGLRVFVTSTTYNGNLGGLSGADAKCQERATAANLPGTYMAWISDAVDGPAARFMTKTGPYILVNGTKVADDWADLTDGTLDAAINRTETNVTPMNPIQVWTNTNIDGTPSSTDKHCVDWGNSMGGSNKGDFGERTVTDSNWTKKGNAACNSVYRLYCFQQ